MSRKKPKKKHKPLQVWIHGEGLRIEATFDNAHLSQMLADALEHVARASNTTVSRSDQSSSDQPPNKEEPHDFDIVQRVIAHADPTVLQAIVDLASHELDKRSTAS